MDDMIFEADVKFAVLVHEGDDELTIAISKFDGVTKVGCGATRKEALFDLFANAFPGKGMKMNSMAAMQLGSLED